MMATLFFQPARKETRRTTLAIVMTRIPALFLLLLAVLSSWVVDSFSPVAVVRSPLAFTTRRTVSYRLSLVEHAAKKKGFGSDEGRPKKKQNRKNKNKQQSSTSSSSPTVTTLASEAPAQVAKTQPTAPEQRPMNAGQKALADMRREKAEQRDAELRKVREMRMADEQVQETPAAIPEKVAQRMGSRMLPFVGLPLLLGCGSFVGFWYMATYRDMEFQPAMVATTTIVILATSLLGITYSVMSASWDEDRDGDVLGVEEFQKNLGNIKEGLGRSRENAILRDKMAGIGESEMSMALTDLERREKAQEKKKREESLQSKLKDELE